MKEWEPDDGDIRCITLTTIVRFEYSGDGLKAAETEIITSIDHRNEVPFAEILQEALPTHLDYHLYQRRRLNA